MKRQKGSGINSSVQRDKRGQVLILRFRISREKLEEVKGTGRIGRGHILNINSLSQTKPPCLKLALTTDNIHTRIKGLFQQPPCP